MLYSYYPLPGLGILLLPIWLGDLGVFIAIPLAEALTCLLGLALYRIFQPEKLINES